MAYDTATPVLVDGLRVRLLFTGPGVPKVEDETYGVVSIEDYARAKIAALNTPRAKTTVAVGTPVDLTPPVAPPVSLKQQWEIDRAAVLRDKQDIDAGIAQPNDAAVKSNSDKAKASRAALIAAGGSTSGG